jgi:hypothetical protein
VIEVRQRLRAAFSELDSGLIFAGARAGDRALAISPWSPLDVGEHVTLANRYLLKLAEKCANKSAAKLERGESASASASELDRMEQISSRDFRWEAPDHMRPTGKVTLESVRATLAQQLQQALRVLDALPANADRMHTIRMTILGPETRLDAREFLKFIALHMERHAAQARRILAAREAIDH